MCKQRRQARSRGSYAYATVRHSHGLPNVWTAFDLDHPALFIAVGVYVCLRTCRRACVLTTQKQQKQHKRSESRNLISFSLKQKKASTKEMAMGTHTAGSKQQKDACVCVCVKACLTHLQLGNSVDWQASRLDS